MATKESNGTFYRVVELVIAVAIVLASVIIAHTSVKAYAEANRASINVECQRNDKQDIRIERNAESDKKVLELLNDLKTQNALVMYRLGIEQPKKEGK